MLSFLKALRRDERGVSALEYAILAGLLVVVLTAVIGTDATGPLGGVFTRLFEAISPSTT